MSSSCRSSRCSKGLGPIDLSGIDWVIAGGESDMVVAGDEEWVTSIRAGTV